MQNRWMLNLAPGSRLVAGRGVAQSVSASVLAAAILTITLMAAGLAGAAAAGDLRSDVDAFALKPHQQTTLGLYLTSREAHRHVTRAPDILFIDARSRAEVNFLGLANAADANIPYGMTHPGFQLGAEGRFYKRIENRYFVAAVRELIARKGLPGNPVIFVMCRDSHGVARVVNELADKGFTQVYSIIDGFEGDLDEKGRRALSGWKNAQLPWSYGIGAKRAYRAPMEAIEDRLSN